MTDDITLVTLINITNAKTERVAPSDGQGLTLFVNGHVITGTLIPSWQMFEDLGKGDGQTAPGNFSPFADDVRKDQRRRAELLDKDPEAWTDEDKEFLGFGPFFVNLSEAQWMRGDGQLAPTGKGVPIRVKLDSVDAFTVGRMSANATPPAETGI